MLGLLQKPLHAQWTSSSGGIYYSGGHVGIGTSNAASGLHVIQTTGGTSSNWYDPGNYATTIHQDLNGTQHYGLLVSDRWRTAENFVFAVDGRFTNGSGTIAEDTHNPYFLVRGDGNVGIGTTSPQYLLSVNGTIQAKEVIVNTGWSDYVFAPTYNLRSLESTAAYVKQYRHLPDMPSEAEVREKGVSVGDVESKLLAKVEELTLQMIKLNEANKELAARLAQVEDQKSRGAR